MEHLMDKQMEETSKIRNNMETIMEMMQSIQNRLDDAGFMPPRADKQQMSSSSSPPLLLTPGSSTTVHAADRNDVPESIDSSMVTQVSVPKLDFPTIYGEEVQSGLFQLGENGSGGNDSLNAGLSESVVEVATKSVSFNFLSSLFPSVESLDENENQVLKPEFMAFNSVDNICLLSVRQNAYEALSYFLPPAKPPDEFVSAVKGKQYNIMMRFVVGDAKIYCAGYLILALPSIQSHKSNMGCCLERSTEVIEFLCSMTYNVSGTPNILVSWISEKSRIIWDWLDKPSHDPPGLVTLIAFSRDASTVTIVSDRMREISTEFDFGMGLSQMGHVPRVITKSFLTSSWHSIYSNTATSILLNYQAGRGKHGKTLGIPSENAWQLTTLIDYLILMLSSAFIKIEEQVIDWILYWLYGYIVSLDVLSKVIRSVSLLVATNILMTLFKRSDSDDKFMKAKRVYLEKVSNSLHGLPTYYVISDNYEHLCINMVTDETIHEYQVQELLKCCPYGYCAEMFWGFEEGLGGLSNGCGLHMVIDSRWCACKIENIMAGYYDVNRFQRWMVLIKQCIMMPLRHSHLSKLPTIFLRNGVFAYCDDGKLYKECTTEIRKVVKAWLVELRIATTNACYTVEICKLKSMHMMLPLKYFQLIHCDFNAQIKEVKPVILEINIARKIHYYGEFDSGIITTMLLYYLSHTEHWDAWNRWERMIFLYYAAFYTKASIWSYQQDMIISGTKQWTVVLHCDYYVLEEMNRWYIFEDNQYTMILFFTLPRPPEAGV